VLCALRPLDRGDFRADKRALDEIERQHVDTGIVARNCEIAVQEFVSEVRSAVGTQVHREKRRLTDGVDVAELAVELERVERHDRAVAPEKILQMQVAVALAVGASRGTLLEHGREARGAPLRPGAQSLELPLWSAASQVLAELVDVT